MEYLYYGGKLPPTIVHTNHGLKSADDAYRAAGGDPLSSILMTGENGSIARYSPEPYRYDGIHQHFWVFTEDTKVCYAHPFTISEDLPIKERYIKDPIGVFYIIAGVPRIITSVKNIWVYDK